MKTYLEKFTLPSLTDEEEFLWHLGYEKRSKMVSSYPFRIFSYKEFSEIDFAPVTIFYGGNGSGKSTLLNIITETLNIRRISERNENVVFGDYCSMCDYNMGWDEDFNIPLNIPNGSSLLTSDDVFEYMFASRMHNSELSKEYEDAYAYYKIKRGKDKKKAAIIKEADYFDIDNYEEKRTIALTLSHSHSARQFAEKVIGKKTKPNSNGETALDFFIQTIKSDKLYLLDEPENSMSPKFQLELTKLLYESARYCDCQLVIATHSPFLLSLPGAKIYDLDTTPVDIKKWHELENTKIYFEHFYKNKDLFLNNKS